MLQAAREGRWEDLALLDAERAQCLSRVTDADLVSTHPADIEAKSGLIESILACDEQTRALAGARRSELAEVLGSMDNARKLADAYGGG